MSAPTTKEEAQKLESARGGRRKGDRRKAQMPFDGPDRRKGERRSGTDRRANARHSAD